MKKTMTRIAACSLAVLIAFGSVCYKPPKARALGVESAFAAAATFSYLEAVGMSFEGSVYDGMRDSLLDILVDLSDNFVSGLGILRSDFEAIIAEGVDFLENGHVRISSAAANMLGQFSDWLVDKFGLIGEDGTPVENVPFIDGVSVLPFVPDSALVDRPYVVIYQAVDGSFWAMCSAEPAYIYSASNGYAYAMRNCVGCEFKDGVWSVGKPNPDVGLVGVRLVSSIWSNHDISHDVYGVTASTYTGIFPSAESGVYIGLDDNYEVPPKVEEQYSMVIDTGMTFADGKIPV